MRWKASFYDSSLCFLFLSFYRLRQLLFLWASSRLWISKTAGVSSSVRGEILSKTAVERSFPLKVSGDWCEGRDFRVVDEFTGLLIDMFDDKLFYKQNRSWLCWLAGRISVNGRKQSVWQSVRPNWAPLDGQWMITRGRWSSNQFRFGGRFMNFVRHTVKDQSFYEPQPPFPSSPPGLCPSKPAPWLSIALGCFLGCCGTTGLHGNKIMTSLLPSCCRQPGVWPSTATARHWRCTNTSQWEQLSGQMTHRKKYQNFYCPKFF